MAKKEKGFTFIEIMLIVMIMAFILAIAVPNALRARRSSMRYTCIGNLRQLDSAKSLWATEHSGAPSMEDLIPDHVRVAPECPAGGIYTLGEVGNNTTCSIEGHSIDENEE